MRTLVPEKRVDKNGRLVTKHVSPDRSNSTSSARSLPPLKLTSGYLAENENEYIWHQLDYSSIPSDDAINEVKQWAHTIIDAIPVDWLPESVTHLEDAESLSDFSQADYAYSQCAAMSEGITGWLRSGDRGARDVGVPYHAKVIQGLPDAGWAVTCHYAVAVQMEKDSDPVIVDFTYAQLDESAEFPLVLSPQEWQERLVKDAMPGYLHPRS